MFDSLAFEILLKSHINYQDKAHFGPLLPVQPFMIYEWVAVSINIAHNRFLYLQRGKTKKAHTL